MNPYFNLYYRLFNFARKVGTVDAPWTALLLISLLGFFNIATVVFFLFDGSVVIIKAPKVFGALVILLIGIINYFIFLRKGRFIKIIQLYKEEKKSHKVSSSVITIVYIISTWYLAHRS